mmetsp:Transcript_27230/g.41184  ORF Transcript_27230/g.41184 Transcript_27230/m.41184 type:complete len:307 (-) Transcript_27230:159-1079(-)|eukprot:CAMPEP_0178916640 /NCGR_PEP_ID=MMETSP0786-20121207/12767_1 /TAXON_ID=186022 /ORGANISM="Thalassionema frauenfeldii, Strain CCMP 1798" /LENGTH=306 /DNA_ID=CAMNT_0020590029 /DNA_START=121 /DNA_END=1041 /DNA_ORIENTATION=+
MGTEETTVEQDGLSLTESRTHSFPLFGSKSDPGSYNSRASTNNDTALMSKSVSRSDYSSFDETDYSSVASSDAGMTTDDEGGLPFLNNFVDSFCSCVENVHGGGVGNKSTKNKEYRDTSLLYRSRMNDSSSKVHGNIKQNQYLKKFASENKIRVPLEKKHRLSNKGFSNNRGPMKRLRKLVQRNPKTRKGKRGKGTGRTKKSHKKKTTTKSRDERKLKNVDENATYKSDQSPESEESGKSPKTSSKVIAAESSTPFYTPFYVDNTDDMSSRSWKQKISYPQKARSSPFASSSSSMGDLPSISTRSF